MPALRPYLIRAIHDWIVDNAMTPYLLVQANAPGVDIPQDFADEDGKIVLNIGAASVRGLTLENDAVRFNARFNGIPTVVAIPPRAVLGIYAKENGKGMLFNQEEEEEEETPPSPPPPTSPPKPTGRRRPSSTTRRPGKTTLKVVK